MKKNIKFLSLILCILLLIPAVTSCAGKTETLIEYEGKTLSKNEYEFLLSRMKGTLAYYGYEVDKPSFWKTVVSLEGGTTYDDYFRATILQEAKHYVIAEKMFDDEGLRLTQDDEKKIDDLIDAYVKKAGSETKLNEELMQYGVNCDILRDVYVREAKIELLKTHLYGKDGEKIEKSEKDKYFNENYVAFKQIFLATYEYLIDTDRFGDTVYYTNNKHEAIAYDKINGKTKVDEFGKEVKDILGNPEYYTADGKIAYDKEKGVIGYATDKNGDKIITELSDEKKAKIYDNAKKYATECEGNFATFEEYIKKYDESEGSALIYLYSSDGYYAAQNDAVAYFDDMAELLSTLDAGECSVFKSDYGYHVVCRYNNEDGAYDKKENKDMFSDFYESLISRLFETKCSEHEANVTVYDDVLDSTTSMEDVGSNTLY